MGTTTTNAREECIVPRPTPLCPWDPPRAGKWRLLARLGVGGQATVYLGIDDDGVKAAIKVLHIDRPSSATLQHGLEQEWASVTRLVPFLTAKVLDFDPIGPLPFIASEYIPGPTLSESVRDKGPLTPSSLHQIAVQTMTALEAIHEARLIHCDFKPANVMLGRYGARVIDFGIARSLDSTYQRGEVSGTIPFMAPEQIMDARLSPKVDLFAWASTMVFAGTGRRAFPEHEPTELLRQIIRDPPQLYDLDGSMRDILRLCLHKDPRRRPTAASARRLLLGLPGRAPAQTRRLTTGSGAAVTTRRLAFGWVPAASGAGGRRSPRAPGRRSQPDTQTAHRLVPARDARPRRSPNPVSGDSWRLRTLLMTLSAVAMVVWIVGFMAAG